MPHAWRDSRAVTRGCAARRPSAPAAPGQVFLVPSFPGRGGPRSLALALCGSRTHLTPLPQRPGWGCFHALLSGAKRRRPCGRDGDSAEFRPREPPAPQPPPPPPLAGKAARDARCLVERPGRGLEPGRHWRLRPARRPALAHWPRATARRAPAAAHLRAGVWRGEMFTASSDSAQWLPVLTDPHDKGLPCVPTAELSPE